MSNKNILAYFTKMLMLSVPVFPNSFLCHFYQIILFTDENVSMSNIQNHFHEIYFNAVIFPLLIAGCGALIAQRI